MRLSTIFKNRWMAVLWAAGIVWMAIDVADNSPHGPSNDSDIANVTAAMNGIGV